MRYLVLMLLAVAPAIQADDHGSASDVVRLPVHYVDEELRPIHADYLPESIQFTVQPIPGGLVGVPAMLSLIDVEAAVGDTLAIDLGSIEESVASTAMRFQRTGTYSTANVVPEDVRVLRLGTFSASATDAQFNASTGIAAAADKPVTLVLAWFDRAVDIDGRGESAGTEFTFDISIPDAGFSWIQFEEVEEGRYYVSERRSEAEPYITIEVVQVQWVVLEKSEDGYRLMGKDFEHAAGLPAHLYLAGAHGVLLGSESDWNISDVAALAPILNSNGFSLYFRDTDGNVRRINQVPGQ